MKNVVENLGFDQSFLLSLNHKIRFQLIDTQKRILFILFHPDVSHASESFIFLFSSLEELHQKMMRFLPVELQTLHYGVLELEKEKHKLEAIQRKIDTLLFEIEDNFNKKNQSFPLVFQEKKKKQYSLYDIAYNLGLSHEFVSYLFQNNILLSYIQHMKKNYHTAFSDLHFRRCFLNEIIPEIENNRIIQNTESYQDFTEKKQDILLQECQKERREIMKKLLFLYEHKISVFDEMKYDYIRVWNIKNYTFEYKNFSSKNNFLSFVIPFSKKNKEEMSIIDRNLFVDVLDIVQDQYGKVFFSNKKKGKSQENIFSLKQIELFLQFLSFDFQDESLFIVFSKNKEQKRYASVFYYHNDKDNIPEFYKTHFRDAFFEKILGSLSVEKIKEYISFFKITTLDELCDSFFRSFTDPQYKKNYQEFFLYHEAVRLEALRYYFSYAFLSQEEYVSVKDTIQDIINTTRDTTWKKYFTKLNKGNDEKILKKYRKR